MSETTLFTAIGLMSGTSMDGIDLAVLQSDGKRIVRRGPASSVAYESKFRDRLQDALVIAKSIRERNERPGDLEALETEITMRHAAAVDAFIEQLPEEFAAVDLIGFHGQTVLHRPEKALTVQLGDGPLLARETGMVVVYDMRANDMANGGQGAPLVPVYHVALAANLAEEFRTPPWVFVNIGGIANMTYVPVAGDPVAFDCGPGNMLIDQWVAAHGGIPFDQGGMIANEGQVVEQAVESYLGASFFSTPGPKSMDRGDMTLQPVSGLELADGARTLAAVSARAIHCAAAHLPSPPKLWIICGGGRKNPHILADLSKLVEVDGGRIMVAEDAGLDGDAMEAEAWAYLAIRSKLALPLTYPSTTGCRQAATGGLLVQPSQKRD